MIEHDGCEGCKHEWKDEDQEPCRMCRHSHMIADWDRFKDLYEPKTPVTQDDVVNHPSHYCQDGGMECIDEMIEVFGVHWTRIFCLLNVWKYRKRAVFKNGEEDMKKSDWYMRKWKELKAKEGE